MHEEVNDAETKHVEGVAPLPFLSGGEEQSNSHNPHQTVTRSGGRLEHLRLALESKRRAMTQGLEMLGGYLHG